jgi:hypothetical protein
VVAELTLRALKAVGPEKLGELVERTSFLEWGLTFDEERLDYDAAPSSERATKRRGLPRIVRDMNRAFGHPEHDGEGPTMRELLAMARQYAHSMQTQPAVV